MSKQPEFKPGGGVPEGAVYASREDIGPIIRINFSTNASQAADQLQGIRDQVEEFTRHMAEQDPERLERDRAEAWGGDPTRHSPDAMVVTYDDVLEK